MTFPGRFIILASLCLLALSTSAPAQANGDKFSPSADAPTSVDAVALQKKASEVQARIRANESDRDQLKRAIKTNEVPLALEILLRNGFTAKDLENAKVNLRTGGGKGGEDNIEIIVACCDPKEITVRRTLENFTK